MTLCLLFLIQNLNDIKFTQQLGFYTEYWSLKVIDTPDLNVNF
jgi:hypothetical protein